MNKRPAVAFGILFLTLVIDSAGCHLSEGFDYFKSLYLTIVTISTVGYGDVYARSTGGMIFALVLIIAGVGTMFYTVSLFAETLVENRLQDIMGREKMKRMIITMKKHNIICGCGRIGFLICRELAAGKVPFVVIEQDPAATYVIEKGDMLITLGEDANVMNFTKFCTAKEETL